jgi:SAM-dependent methyltransferase
MSQRSPESPAEFDAYAADYGAGMDVGLKRCLGDSAESFLEVKVAWLLRDLARRPLPGAAAACRLLDYGCGAGTFLQVLRRMDFPAALAGCDVSAEMLLEAKKRWDGGRWAVEEAGKRWPQGEPPKCNLIENGRAPYEPASFDLVVLSAVMHHVEVARRNDVYSDALRLLRTGGRLIVFEHNPFNPVTQWVVRHTPIDRNAVLLSPREVLRGLTAVGSARARVEYLMFFPPRLTLLRPWERFLRWFPLGAQYVVAADKLGDRT